MSNNPFNNYFLKVYSDPKKKKNQQKFTNIMIQFLKFIERSVFCINSVLNLIHVLCIPIFFKLVDHMNVNS